MLRHLKGCGSLRIAALAAALALGAHEARAAYVQYGNGMQQVAGGSVANGGLFVASNNTWVNLVTPSKPYTMTTDFDLPPCDTIADSRLVLTVWGGTKDYACDLKTTVNGVVVSDLNMGGADDANPVFSPTAANVYGTGSGVWLVSIPVSSAALHVNSLASVHNTVAVTVSNPSGNFDGRISQATLWSVYQKASLDNTFEYAIAEGSGDIYRGTTGAPKSRTVALDGVGASDVVSATLHAMYTYGDKNQNDRLYFNGFQLGGDDVANKQNGYTALDYVPDLVGFDVTSLVQGDNSLKFSADALDGIPGTLESSLRPELAILEVEHEVVVPEPATAALAWTGAAALSIFLVRRRRCGRSRAARRAAG